MNHRPAAYRKPAYSRREALLRLGAQGVALAALAGGLGLGSSPARASTEGARDFIEHLGERATGTGTPAANGASLRDILAGKPVTEKQALQRLIGDALDIDSLGRFALGSFLRQSNPQKVQEFLGVFRAYVLMTYPDLLAKLNIRHLKVVSVKGFDPETSLVLTEIGYGANDGGGDADGDKAEVGWYVREVAAGAYKVQDVQLDGHSLRVFQRAKFEKILRDRWIDGLIKIMQGWVQNGREEPYL